MPRRGYTSRQTKFLVLPQPARSGTAAIGACLCYSYHADSQAQENRLEIEWRSAVAASFTLMRQMRGTDS